MVCLRIVTLHVRVSIRVSLSDVMNRIQGLFTWGKSERESENFLWCLNFFFDLFRLLFDLFRVRFRSMWIDLKRLECWWFKRNSCFMNTIKTWMGMVAITIICILPETKTYAFIWSPHCFHSVLMSRISSLPGYWTTLVELTSWKCQKYKVYDTKNKPNRREKWKYTIRL